MNIAHKPGSKAVADASRPALALRRVYGVVLGAMLAGTMLPAAHAGDKERDAQRPAQLQPAQPVRERMPPPQPTMRQDINQARQYDRIGDSRAEDQRRQQMQQEQNARNAEAVRRGERMTPDERRDLRRQINEAGADLYQRTPRR